MKKLWAGLMALVVSVVIAQGAWAADVASVKAQLMVARENAVALLSATDVAAQDKFVAEIAKATAAVDAGVAALLADKGTAAEVAAKIKEFQETWGPFKQTRDGEIVPMLRAGKKDEATVLLKGIQAERFKKLLAALEAAGAK
ncbi:MCP four helix bundle domain-containing protein [uncultured Gammaproteobacteria bacterium]